MKKDFLSDYEAKEVEAYEQYREGLTTGNKTSTFPEIRRFANAQTPLILAETGLYADSGLKIWSQILFAKNPGHSSAQRSQRESIGNECI